jgi:hypothetical protein
MMYSIKVVALPLLILLTCISCGYRLVGTGSMLPKDIKTVTIPVFTNQTLEYGIETVLTNDLMDEFAGRGNLKVIDDKTADSELIGIIKNYKTTVLTYDSYGNPQQYRVEIGVSVTFTNKIDNTILFKDENITKTEVYIFENGNITKLGSDSSTSSSLTPDDRAKYQSDTVVTRDDAENAAMKMISKNIAEYIASIVFVGF